jgi:hypothetical protein
MANCGGLWDKRDKKIKDKGINGQDGENSLSFYHLSFYPSSLFLNKQSENEDGMSLGTNENAKMSGDKTGK